MDHKKVTKQMLREYVSNKVRDQKTALQNEQYTIVSAKLDPALKEWINADQVESEVARLVDKLNSIIDICPDAASWKVRNSIRDLNGNLGSIGNHMRADIKDTALNCIRQPHAYSFKYSEANKFLAVLVKQLQVDTADIRNKLADLDTLEFELNRVIDQESTGHKAYKALAALSVDLSGIADPSPNLPAVIKLSVDPSLLTAGNES